MAPVRKHRALWVLSVAFAGACVGQATVGKGAPDGGAASDAGSVDAGSVDAGSADAGSADAGSADAGSTDAGAADAGAAYYTTSFPLVENPISEGGQWHNQGTLWTQVQTTGGLACGTQNNTPLYDDSYAYLTGFPPDLHVTAVMHNTVPSGIVQETEILFRWTDSATSAQGYEVNLNSGGAAQIVRWNGALGYEVADRVINFRKSL
jgi:hypothetical protein